MPRQVSSETKGANIFYAPFSFGFRQLLHSRASAESAMPSHSELHDSGGGFDFHPKPEVGERY